MSCIPLCSLNGLIPFLSELAIQGMADACFPERIRSIGFGQFLAVRTKCPEQLSNWSGKAGMGTRHMLLQGRPT